MKVQLYGIFDSCSGIYEKPFFSRTDDLVKREFQDVVNTKDHPINRHPEHYSLWRLGNFDNNTGKVLDEANECLWQGVEALSQEQEIESLDAQQRFDLEPEKKLGDEDMQGMTPAEFYEANGRLPYNASE